MTSYPSEFSTSTDEGMWALSSQGTTLRTAARDAASEATTGTAAVNETAATCPALKAVSTKAVAAMTNLEERSSQVEVIVETIDIADQINLLALNVAIEAARGRAWARLRPKKVAPHSRRRHSVDHRHGEASRRQPPSGTANPKRSVRCRRSSRNLWGRDRRDRRSGRRGRAFPGGAIKENHRRQRSFSGRPLPARNSEESRCVDAYARAWLPF